MTNIILSALLRFQWVWSRFFFVLFFVFFFKNRGAYFRDLQSYGYKVSAASQLVNPAPNSKLNSIFHCSDISDIFSTWWRHQMKTLSALLAICAGYSPVPGEFPTQRPVTWSFDVYFDLRPNKRLSKQSWGWWFETLSPPVWSHRNEHTCVSGWGHSWLR